MDEKIALIKEYMEGQISRCRAQERALYADDRGDEAVLMKVQSNVYDIFSTVLDVAEKNAGGDGEKLAAFFQSRMEAIPAAWQESLAKAELHGDDTKAHTERVKLRALADIREAFETIWEGTR